MKREYIGMGLVLCSIFGHAYAYYFWPEMTIKNLYYISIYFLLYINGFAFSMITQTTFGKVVSGVMMTFGGYLLFIEFSGDPKKWEQWQFWLGFLVILQGFLTVLIIEKLKKK